MGCLPFNRPRATTNHNRSANCSKYGAAHACLLPMAMVASSLSWGNSPQPCMPCYDIAVTRPRPRPGIALLAETPATPVDPYKLTKQTKHAAIRASNTATEQTAVLHAPFPTPNPLWAGPRSHTARSTLHDVRHGAGVPDGCGRLEEPYRSRNRPASVQTNRKTLSWNAKHWGGT
jgi:hypothetical protein